MTLVKQLQQAAGRRKYARHGGVVCSRCYSVPPANGQAYCTPCHNAYMREWRKTHPLTPEQRFKDNARSYAAVYKKRGKLHQVPCEKCGSPRSQMHHHDYSKPLEVDWLCRPCHMRLHEQEGYQHIHAAPQPRVVTSPFIDPVFVAVMADEAETVVPLSMCKCGRAPIRKSQRNCHYCNRDAGAKYRLSMKQIKAAIAFFEKKNATHS